MHVSMAIGVPHEGRACKWYSSGFSLKYGSVAQRHAEKSVARDREDANMRMCVRLNSRCPAKLALTCVFCLLLSSAHTHGCLLRRRAH